MSDAKPPVKPAPRPSFIGEFLRNPIATAAIAPSSQALARAMLDGIDLASVRTVVEYGPGTGVFTRHTLAALRAAGNTSFRFVALELNTRLANALHASLPDIEVHNTNADEVERVLAAKGGAATADLVISGLGWPSLPPAIRASLLERTARILPAGREFRTFGYHIGLTMPGAWDFRRRVRELFAEVTISPVIWGNIPPAFVYRCVAGHDPAIASTSEGASA